METEIKNWERMHRALQPEKKGKSGPHAASNMFIAWPVVLQIIKEGVMENSKVLDYGCGTGGFCRHMRSEGMKVEGMDFSASMIETAVKKSPRQIHYHTGGKDALKQVKGTFDVITALMVFQFMKDFEACIPLFNELLNDRGLLVFSVHNPDFVENCCNGNVGFRSMRRAGENDHGQHGNRK